MKRRLDTIMLAIGLFTLSGAVLCYNLATLESGVPASAVKYGGAISSRAAAAIEYEDAVEVAAITNGKNYEADETDLSSAAMDKNASESGAVHAGELLPPIVRPD